MTAIVKQISSEELNKKLKSTIRGIDKELRSLGVDTQQNFIPRTNGTSFKYNELDPNTVNILTFLEPTYLIRSLAKMKRIKKEAEELMLELGISTYPVIKWCNHDIDAWIHDLTYRVKLVVNHGRIQELNKARQELVTFLSTEDRLASTLDSLSSILKNK